MSENKTVNEAQGAKTAASLSGVGSTAGSASSIDHEKMLMQMSFNRLSQHPQLQAEAIASHYVAHATIARQLLFLVGECKHIEPWPDIERYIQLLVDEIKANHRTAFGIALEWPNAGGESPADQKKKGSK